MEKKTALITGSYGGLGTCFVNIHAARGGSLILVGRSRKKLDDQAKCVQAQYGADVQTIAADLSASDAAGFIYDTCAQNGWAVDYLINNAGFGGRGDFSRERTMEQDLTMIAVNIETPTRLCKLFLPDWVKRGSGRVLNVSSVAALVPGPLQAVYFATKAYVTSWSNALWRELRGTGVSVTALMPGPLETGFANTGGLSDTKLFAGALDPAAAAKAGYEGMLKGALNVRAGLRGWQKPIMALAPMLPRKAVLNVVCAQQTAGSAKNRACKMDPSI